MRRVRPWIVGGAVALSAMRAAAEAPAPSGDKEPLPPRLVTAETRLDPQALADLQKLLELKERMKLPPAARSAGARS